MKIWFNFHNSKLHSWNLVTIFERRVSHKSLWFHTTSHIESLQIIWKWNSIWTFWYFNIPINSLVHIFVFEKFIVKIGVLLLRINYINVFTIKLLISNHESFELGINLKMTASSFSKTCLKANFAGHLGRLNKRPFVSWLCLTPTFHTLLMLSKLQICTLLWAWTTWTPLWMGLISPYFCMIMARINFQLVIHSHSYQTHANTI